MSEPNPSHDASGARWHRFNDELFSLQACLDASALVSGLAAKGIELIVDARPREDRDVHRMQADCEEAGVYYVPAPMARTAVDLEGDAIQRYANLALRHKTCLIVDGDPDGLLSLIAEHGFSKVTPLDEDIDTHS
jgi:hypothetical protein